MIIIIQRKATKEEIEKAKEELKDYIKIVADIEKEIAGIGGKYHADVEKLLIESGSKQKDLWGGGFNLITGEIDTQAIINIRPTQGTNSMEILNAKIKEKFIRIARRFLK